MRDATENGSRPLSPSTEGLDLVPRFGRQGYAPGEVEGRRRWVAERTGTPLGHVGRCSIPTESLRGNVENPIGSAQVPLGVAGPLRVNGEFARGVFYVPLATTEGALVRSYERGMLVISRSGGATARVVVDENCITPVFSFGSLVDACTFVRSLPDRFETLRRVAESTTHHGRLMRIEPRVLGRDAFLKFCYHTVDAHGMNMIMSATDAACRWLAERCPATRHFVITGACSEKRAGGAALAGGKGKTVVAEALVPAGLLQTYLRVTPDLMLAMWHRTLLGQVAAGVTGYNGHLANGLAALFIACGQDVANVANAAAGITSFERTAEGDLYLSVTLPSLTIGTVGGGTQLGTGLECLRMMGCAGSGGAPRFAEIAAATALAGELSFGAAIASGEIATAHETYGRNRPSQPESEPGPAPPRAPIAKGTVRA
jgi:hydroxymethylglutaryl-CoA reductase (NADPH)